MGVSNSKAQNYIKNRHSFRKRKLSERDLSSERHRPHVLVTKTTAITDDYTLLMKREIGNGVSGKVILCQHKVSKKKFALKKVRDSKSARREIELQWKASQNFFHIVQLVDVYENKIRNDSYFFMVMEYMEGGELFNRIRNRKKPFTEFEVAKIMKQIALTVKHLHSMGIAHRDLKPENLLLYTKSEKNFVVKLCDFGFAKEAHKGLMTPNYTPYYVAPEILSFEKYDVSCDIWSLGVIMYILCSGYPPFFSIRGNKISPGMESRIKNGIFSFSNKEWTNISKEAKDLIRGMLETIPEKRFTIDDVVNSAWLQDYSKLPKTDLKYDHIKGNEDWVDCLEGVNTALKEMRVDHDSNIIVKKPDMTNNRLYAKRQAKLQALNMNESKTVGNLKAITEKTPSNTPSPKQKLKKSNSLPETASTVAALYYSSNLKRDPD